MEEKFLNEKKEKLFNDYVDWFDFCYIESGNGWIPLIEDMCAKLKALDFNGKIIQIKEKFGGLRFYVSSATNEQWKVIEDGEKKSYSICERCGEPGIFRKNGWLRTLCNEHEKEYHERTGGINWIK